MGMLRNVAEYKINIKNLLCIYTLAMSNLKMNFSAVPIQIPAFLFCRN